MLLCTWLYTLRIYVKNIDVISYSKITSQKGYAGQVTCRCE